MQDRYTKLHWSLAGQTNGHTNVNFHFVCGRTVWDKGFTWDPLNRSYTFPATHWSLRKVLQVLSCNYCFAWHKERYTYTCPTHFNPFAVSTVSMKLELYTRKGSINKQSLIILCGPTPCLPIRPVHTCTTNMGKYWLCNSSVTLCNILNLITHYCEGISI